MSYNSGYSGGGGGGGIGGSTGATDNAILRADGAGGSTVQNASQVTIDDNGGIISAPAKTTWGLNIDRSDNTGDTQGIRIVSGDGGNLAANKAFFITNSSEDRGITQTYETTSSFVTAVDSSSWRLFTTGGVGGRDIRFQPGGDDRLILPVEKDLTDNSTTSAYEVALPTLTGTGGIIKGSVFATDGVDVQCRSFAWRYTAVNKGGVYTTEIAVVSENISASAGTLPVTWTILNGANKVTLQVIANSSLVPTTLRLHYTIESFSDQAITLL